MHVAMHWGGEEACRELGVGPFGVLRADLFVPAVMESVCVYVEWVSPWLLL